MQKTTIIGMDSHKQRYVQALVGVDDRLTRQAIYYRYICGYTWAQVATAMGNNHSPDSLRMMVKRGLERISV